MTDQTPGPGEQVDADAPGVPNDPPGPDVPQDKAGTESPEVPGHPTDEQPDAGADDAPEDSDETTEGIAQVGDVEGASDDSNPTHDDDSEEGPGGEGTGEGGGDGPSDIGAPTRPAEPAS